MSSDTLSVIVPAYQAEATIARCLRSILAAKTNMIEVIVVDDGSTDTTPHILSNFKDADSRLIVIRQENHGRSAARNKGLERASGAWIMFVDADDYMVDGYYEIISERLYDSSDCTIYRVGWADSRGTGQRSVINSRDILACLLNPASDKVEKNIRKKLRAFWLGPVYARIYRREMLSGVHFEEGLRFGEDLIFNCDALERGTTEVCDKTIYIFDDAVPGTIGNFRIEDIKYTNKLINVMQKLQGRPSINSDDLLACMGNEIIQLSIRAARFAPDREEAIEAIASMLDSEEIRTIVSSARYEGIKDALHFGSIRRALANGDVRRAFALEQGYQALKQVVNR